MGKGVSGVAVRGEGYEYSGGQWGWLWLEWYSVKDTGRWGRAQVERWYIKSSGEVAVS